MQPPDDASSQSAFDCALVEADHTRTDTCKRNHPAGHPGVDGARMNVETFGEFLLSDKEI